MKCGLPCACPYNTLTEYSLERAIPFVFRSLSRATRSIMGSFTNLHHTRIETCLQCFPVARKVAVRHNRQFTSLNGSRNPWR